MKIIHIVENLDSRYGGPAKSVPLLVKYLDKLGIENIIVSVQEYENESNPVLNEYNYNIKKAKILGPSKIRFAPKLKKIIKSEITKDTIIHIHAIWTYPVYIAYKVAKETKTPFMVASRGMLYKWSLSQSSFIKKLALKLYAKDMLKEANAIHITESNEKEDIIIC